jgi:parallel beta-helix repeat protein
MKKLLIYFSMLLCLQATAATTPQKVAPWKWVNPFSVTATRTFYISPTGNDANTTTQAQSQSTPWKTLGAHTGSLAAGDTVKFQCGGTYFDSIDNKTANTTLTSYGSGAQPNITGFYSVTTWTSLGNGIYESEAIPTNIGCRMVNINGKAYAMGRYPNANATNDGYLTFESHSGTTSITDNQLSTTAINSTYIGAQICLRVTHYQIARANITGVSGSTITFTGYAASNNSTSVADNYGYFVQNDIKTLDQFGEWYYNPSTKKIDVYFGSSGPTGNTVKIAVKDKLLLAHASNQTITGLTFSGSNYNIYSVFGISNLTITKCNLQFAGFINGLFGSTTHTTLLQDTVSWGHVTGLQWYVTNKDITVRQCVVSDICRFQGMFVKDPITSICGYAIEVGAADSSWVEYNTIKRIGYSGIQFMDGNWVYVRNNTIDSFVMILDDGGGVYDRDFSSTKAKHDRYVVGNIITNGLATGKGVTSNPAIWGGGIYHDDLTEKIVDSGNTVANTTFNGIYLHNNADITVSHNLFYNNAYAGLETQHENSSETVAGLIFRGNTVIAATTSQQFINHRSNWDDLKTAFSVIDSNYYGRFTNDNSSFTANYFQGTSQSLTFSGWQSYIGGEVHSVRTNIADMSKVILKTNLSLVVPKDYQVCTSSVGFDGKTITNKFSLNPYQSNAIIGR